jgi:hypothetical protein
MSLVSFSGALIAVGSLALCSCSSSGASGGGQGTPAVQQTPICGQACQDDTAGYALDDTMWLLWNENIAGQPSGAQNMTVQCPLGGTAALTGTTAVASNGISTVHLTLGLQGCENSNATYTLAFGGSLTWDGTFGSGYANAVTFKSTALDVSGTIREYDMPAVMESCPVALTDTFDKSANNQTGWLNGAICGRAAAE